MNTETANGTALIFDRLGQAMFPELTAGASEHLVRISPLQESEQDLTETDQALSEKCSVFLANLKKKTDPNGLSTKMLRECCQAIAGGDFLSIILAMEELGYDLEWQVFNSKYHGVPQNRERVYTLGHLRARGERKVFPLCGAAEEDSADIEILGHYDGYRRNRQTFSYNGITEALSTCEGGGIEHHTAIPMFGIDKNVQETELECANALTAREDRGVSNFKQTGTAVAVTVGFVNPEKDGSCRTLKAQMAKNSLANFIRTDSLGATAVSVAIPVLTPDRAEKRQNGRRFKDNGEDMFTLTAQDKHGVALKIREATTKGYAEAEIGDSVNLSMPESKTRRGRVEKKQANTLDTSCEQGVVVPVIWYEKYKCYIAIRKLTPKECWRLQGWTDDYFEKAQFVNSDSQLYKQAGNGVTVNVVEDIARAIGEIA